MKNLEIEKPQIIKDFEEQLQSHTLPENKKIILQIGRTMQRQGYLYFSSGIYNDFGSSLQVPETVIDLFSMNLKEYTKYNIYFNPSTVSFSIQEANKEIQCRDEYVGEFMIEGCKLVFTPPETECWKYIKAFTDGYSEGYMVGGMYKNVCLDCAEFTFQYNDDYNNTCTLDAATLEDPLDCRKDYDDSLRRPVGTSIICD